VSHSCGCFFTDFNFIEKDVYFTVKTKFIFCIFLASSWLFFSFWLSFPWIRELATYVSLIPALIIIFSIALLPGFMYMFLVVSYLVDQRKSRPFPSTYPAVTVLIAAYNEASCIEATLNSIRNQDYPGELQIILVDDGSTDETISKANALGIPKLQIVQAHHGGKAAALNYGLTFAGNELIVTIDADTFLLSSAIREIVNKFYTGPAGTVAVAGSVYVKNSRKNWVTKIQEWDYFHAIAIIKRTQSLFQGTLVAQGAFSLYKKTALLEVGGWPETVGEDIVMTWALLNRGYRVDFAEDAISFTNAPDSYRQFFFQRSRWARGLLEAFRHHPKILLNKRLSTFYVYWNLCFILIDFVFGFVFIPGLIAAFLGYFFIAGPYTLAVMPLGLLNNLIFFRGQKRLFKKFGLRVRKNIKGFIIYFLCYQILMNPAVIHGYIAEFARFKRRWGTK
jgi:biofilm PGA synthesis N-glycosyltransferase PgaC